MDWCCYPILTISAVVSFSRSGLEGSSPRGANSKNSFSSAICLSSPSKNLNEPDKNPFLL